MKPLQRLSETEKAISGQNCSIYKYCISSSKLKQQSLRTNMKGLIKKLTHTASTCHAYCTSLVTILCPLPDLQYFSIVDGRNGKNFQVKRSKRVLRLSGFGFVTFIQKTRHITNAKDDLQIFNVWLCCIFLSLYASFLYFYQQSCTKLHLTLSPSPFSMLNEFKWGFSRRLGKRMVCHGKQN